MWLGFLNFWTGEGVGGVPDGGGAPTTHPLSTLHLTTATTPRQHNQNPATKPETKPTRPTRRPKRKREKKNKKTKKKGDTTTNSRGGPKSFGRGFWKVGSGSEGGTKTIKTASLALQDTTLVADGAKCYPAFAKSCAVQRIRQCSHAKPPICPQGVQG